VAECFFDTSAIVKRYAKESGSDRVNEIISNDANSVYLLNISTVEFCSALKRKTNQDQLGEAQAKELNDWFDWHCENEYLVVQLQEEDLEFARSLIWAHGLRAYDAIQLSTCHSLHDLSNENEGPEVVFFSADDKLVDAAKKEGISTINPCHDE